MQKQWRAYTSYFAALSVFISSRILMFLAMAFSARFIPQRSGDEFWNEITSWYRYLLRYDSGWYLAIARHGYSYNGNDSIEQTVAFYPFYPLIIRVITIVSGIQENNSILIISNAAIIIAIVLFFKLVKEDYGDEVALYAVALLSFFPTSMFFSAGYTESLAFLLILCFFLFLKKERYFLAAALAGLTFATRSTGIALLLPLLWELWRKFSNDRKRFLLYAAACTVLATSGLWLYMIYLWVAFGKPLAFMTNQAAWYVSGGGSGNSLFKVLTLQPLQYLADIFATGPYPNALDPWFFFLFLFLLIFYRKRLSVSYGLFAMGVLLLPYLTRTGGSFGFMSFMRYILLAFPVFIVMAEIFRRKPWLGWSAIGLFAGLLFMYAAMFAQWQWVG